MIATSFILGYVIQGLSRKMQYLHYLLKHVIIKLKTETQKYKFKILDNNVISQ